MKTVLKKSFILLILIYIIALVLDVAFTQVYKKGHYFKTQWIYNKSNEHYDYAILGASRSISALNFGTLHSNNNLKGINLSLDGSYISTQKLLLELFLSKGNTVKKLYLNIDTWQINNNFVSPFSYPRFFPYIYDSLVYEHYKKLDPKWIYYRYIPFLRYADFNFDWGALMFLNSLLDISKPDYDNYGCFFYPNIKYDGVNDPQDYLFDLDADYTYFNELIKICKTNNIEIITFIPPIVNYRNSKEVSNNHLEFQMKILNGNIPLVDYSDLFVGKYNLFTDESHLNPNGVKEFTLIFKKELLKSFSKNL